MKRSTIIAFLILIGVLGFSQNSFSASFDLSTNKIFTPQEEATITISSMDVPALDIRLYRIDDPVSYFLDLSDVHSPTMKTKRDLSSPSEMAGGVKRKVLGLFREDYRSVLSEDIRKEVVSALGLPHVSEPESPPPQSYELFPVLDGYKLINRWEERLVYTKKGKWEYHEIPIKIDDVGVYLVEAIYQDMVAYTAVVVSSIAFIVKNSPTDDLMYVTDRVTGEPESGVKVSIWGSDKKPLASGKTNRDGIFYSEADIGENYSLYVFAEKDDNFTLADPYTYFWWSDSKDRVYTYTDRPVYRPNHTVYFRSIIREAKKSGLEVPDRNDTYLVIIKDSKGNEIYRKDLTINEFGSLSGDFKLGPEPPLGEYDIIVFFDDTNFYSYFKVEEYKKPEFEVKVETDSDVYIRGARITANVDAKYYFGSPVSGGQVEYVIYRSVYERPWWWGYEWGWYFMDDDYYWTHDRVMVDSGSAVLNDDGKLTIKVDTSRFAEGEDNDYTFTIEAVVTDLSRREVSGSTAVKVARSNFSMIVRANRWIYSPGDEANVTVSALDFDNKGVGGINVNLIATETDQEKNVMTYSQTLTGITEPDGEVTFKYQVKGTGRVDFVATSFDTFGNFTTSKDYAYCYDWARGYAGDISEGSISIIPDKDTYALGDTAHILIISPVEDTHMLVTTESRSINDVYVMKIKGGSAMLDLKIEDKHTPNMFVTASLIFNDELYTETKRVVIPPEHKFINIEIISDKEVYEPQEEGTFKIKTTDSRGKPVSCEVSLGMVDDAIYAISPETVVEIEKYFYKLYPHIVETSSSLYFSFYGYSHRKGLLAALEGKETTLADFKGDSLVEPRIRKDFKDTMYWSPSIKTGIDGTATATLKFPDNLTRWRATVRGVTKGSEVGEMTYRVISRKDLIVRIETPRFFRQGDELIISTIAHNYLSEDKKVKFTFEISGLELLGGSPKEVIVPKNSEWRIDWKVRATDVGSAVLTAKAMTNEESDGMELTIPVLPMGIKVTENDMREIIKDSGSLKLTFVKPRESIKNASELQIDISPTLVNTMLSAIPFLVGYPYG